MQYLLCSVSLVEICAYRESIEFAMSNRVLYVLALLCFIVTTASKTEKIYKGQKLIRNEKIADGKVIATEYGDLSIKLLPNGKIFSIIGTIVVFTQFNFY